MKMRDKILSHFGMPEEKRNDIIIHRLGGWLVDTINPKIWPGSAGDISDFDPEIPSARLSVYVEFSIKKDGVVPEPSRLEFRASELEE